MATPDIPDAPAGAAPRPGCTDDVLYAREGVLGRALLARPKAINSLTGPMVESLLAQLDAWADDDAVAAVAIEGLGPKGLCAGGDMRAARESALAGTDDAMAFFRTEYAMNGRLATYPKPVVAFMDGIVMGGGVGISGHDSLRLATERTRLAMPETAIGFFPDVGGSKLLADAPGELGTYLALTGAHATGADAVHLGVADAVIASDAWPGVVERLAAGETLDAGVGEIPDSPLAAQAGWIDECFAGDDAAAILARLEAHPDDAAREAAATIRTRSPLAVCVALEAVRRAATSSLADVLARDVVLAARFVHRSDMPEGVRDVLVDKGTGEPPAWLYPRVEVVPREAVEEMFRPL